MIKYSVRTFTHIKQKYTQEWTIFEKQGRAVADERKGKVNFPLKRSLVECIEAVQGPSSGVLLVSI